MSEINIQLKDGPVAQMPASSTVGEALKTLDRQLAKQALAAKVRGWEVDLARPLNSILAPASPEGTLEFLRKGTWELDPVLPETLEGLDVLRHSTAHLLAAAVLD